MMKKLDIFNGIFVSGGAAVMIAAAAFPLYLILR